MQTGREMNMNVNQELLAAHAEITYIRSRLHEVMRQASGPSMSRFNELLNSLEVCLMHLEQIEKDNAPH